MTAEAPPQLESETRHAAEAKELIARLMRGINDEDDDENAEEDREEEEFVAPGDDACGAGAGADATVQEHVAVAVTGVTGAHRVGAGHHRAGSSIDAPSGSLLHIPYLYLYL